MTRTPYPVKELFAWVVDDPLGQHGVVGVMTPSGLPMQAVSSQRRLMELPAFTEAVQQTAKMSGCRVALKRFVLAETLVTVEPDGPA